MTVPVTPPAKQYRCSASQVTQLVEELTHDLEHHPLDAFDLSPSASQAPLPPLVAAQAQTSSIYDPNENELVSSDNLTATVNGHGAHDSGAQNGESEDNMPWVQAIVDHIKHVGENLLKLDKAEVDVKEIDLVLSALEQLQSQYRQLLVVKGRKEA